MDIVKVEAVTALLESVEMLNKFPVQFNELNALVMAEALRLSKELVEDSKPPVVQVLNEVEEEVSHEQHARRR